MIRYLSTRGHPERYSFTEVVLKGIAPDGGLFVPESIPEFSLSQLSDLVGSSYRERAQFILELFETDLSAEVLRGITKRAYADNFDHHKIAPLTHLKDQQYLLELWHGPTSAFKDMALQLMPLFFSRAARRHNAERVDRGEPALRYLILVATSGDTGKAALEGFKDNPAASITVFYPYGHVSQLQELQMITQAGSNVAVYAVDGDFDAVQTTVKEVFADREFNQRLLERHHIVLSSANSINWGRLLPQIVYHVSSYIDLLERGAITAGEPIDICVPTGNFGNILAAYYAKRMGLPVNMLICASNANNVLTEFLQTGVYVIGRRELLQTPSPSMDILVASNIERLLYTMTGDPQQVASWMSQLSSVGMFGMSGYAKSILQQEFHADWVSNTDCLTNIRRVYQDTGQLIDPHTSVAQLVTERYLQQTGSSTPVVISSTAQWSKFARDVHSSLADTPIPGLRDEFAILKRIQELIPSVSIPETISGLSGKEIRFTQQVMADKAEIEALILRDLSA